MILVAILAVYALSTVLVEGSIFLWLRKETRKLKWLTIGGTFLLDCRLCTGFWVALGVSYFFSSSLWELLAIWGGAYFLATQER